MRIPRWTTILLLPFALLTEGCQTTIARDFSRLKTGMEKPQVLEIMGSPQRTQRWHGLDRWTYYFYDTELRQDREVHFDEGKVVYLGPTYQPEVSAEQQDLLHESSNREVEENFKRRRQEADHNLENYENQMRGTDANPATLPNFKPVR